jgi:ubiquinone/menaquinone biosynthesis C-methylase UbiE
MKDAPLTDILEAGCGAGYASLYLRGRYSSFTGIDFSSELVGQAESVHRYPGVEFLVTDLYQFTPPRKVDAVIMIGVLHHMEDIPRALELCREMLKPGGMMAVNEPQDANRLVRFIRKLRAKYDSTYSPDQEQLDRNKLAAMFRAAGFSGVTVRPQGFFSTPFAEVMLKPSLVFLPLALMGCLLDRFLEKVFGRYLQGLSWNTVVQGKAPGK